MFVDYSLDNVDESSSEEGDSITNNKMDEYHRTCMFSNDSGRDKEEGEDTCNEQNVTRKSKRVKILNKKFNNDENVAHLPLNDFFYYSNKANLKLKNNKILNNRVNEDLSSPKKDKIPKMSLNKKQQQLQQIQLTNQKSSNKKAKDSTEDNSESLDDLNENLLASNESASDDFM